MTSRQKYVELLNLRNGAGRNIYQRLKLADELLSDREWVESPDGGGGDESRAIDRLEEFGFADICGALSLPQLLEVLHHVPDPKDWEKARYNLRKLHAEYKARTAPPARPKATPEATPPPSVEDQLRQARQEVAKLRKENAALKREVKKLRRVVKHWLKEAQAAGVGADDEAP